MIITIDGPAGAGKSSVARALSQRLRFRFLDTGAMYRTVALAALRNKLDWNDPAALVELARGLNIEVRDDRVLLDGQDVSHEVRSIEVTSATHYAANNPGVREVLVDLQRAAVGEDDVVSEGRDQGTVVFPQAECKFFLTASPEERARRRLEDLTARGDKLSLEEVLADQNERDRRDESRAVGPLMPAVDAIQISSDGLSAEEVVNCLEEVVRARMTSSVRQ